MSSTPQLSVLELVAESECRGSRGRCAQQRGRKSRGEVTGPGQRRAQLVAQGRSERGGQEAGVWPVCPPGFLEAISRASPTRGLRARKARRLARFSPPRSLSFPPPPPPDPLPTRHHAHLRLRPRRPRLRCLARRCPGAPSLPPLLVPRGRQSLTPSPLSSSPQWSTTRSRSSLCAVDAAYVLPHLLRLEPRLVVVQWRDRHRLPVCVSSSLFRVADLPDHCWLT